MQQVWRKRWQHTAWFILGATSLVLLVSAAEKKNHKPCKGIEVTFKGDGNNYFIEEKWVENLLKAQSLIKGQPVETIDLRALEATLKKDKWVADAQLFFDNNQVLQAIVQEKIPVARIFTAGGNSYYIDSACKKLPLSEKLSARIPMFTSFPSDREKLSRPDSELLASVKELAMFIQADEFWKAQTAQIDITPDGFEMIPTVGDHLVELGKDGDWQQKFDRLFSFYKEVWTKVGFEKYEKIDVRFDGQVVATVKGAKSAIVDSANAKAAYEDLFADTKKEEDTNITAAVVKDTGTMAKAGFIRNVSRPTNNANLQTRRETNILQGTKTARTDSSIVKHAVEKQLHFKKQPVKQLPKTGTGRTVAADKQPDKNKVPKAVMKKPISSL